MTAELAAALANLQQRPIEVRVPGANRDLPAGAALAMGLLAVVLFAGAGIGWAVRRRPAAPV